MNTYLPIVSLLNETLCMKRIIKSSRMRPPPSLFHLKGGQVIQPPPHQLRPNKRWGEGTSFSVYYYSDISV